MSNFLVYNEFNKELSSKINRAEQSVDDLVTRKNKRNKMLIEFSHHKDKLKRHNLPNFGEEILLEKINKLKEKLSLMTEKYGTIDLVFCKSTEASNKKFELMKSTNSEHFEMFDMLMKIREIEDLYEKNQILKKTVLELLIRKISFNHFVKTHVQAEKEYLENKVQILNQQISNNKLLIGKFHGEIFEWFFIVKEIESLLDGFDESKEFKIDIDELTLILCQIFDYEKCTYSYSWNKCNNKALKFESACSLKLEKCRNGIFYQYSKSNDTRDKLDLALQDEQKKIIKDLGMKIKIADEKDDFDSVFSLSKNLNDETGKLEESLRTIAVQIGQLDVKNSECLKKISKIEERVKRRFENLNSEIAELERKISNYEDLRRIEIENNYLSMRIEDLSDELKTKYIGMSIIFPFNNDFSAFFETLKQEQLALENRCMELKIEWAQVLFQLKQENVDQEAFKREIGFIQEMEKAKLELESTKRTVEELAKLLKQLNKIFPIDRLMKTKETFRVSYLEVPFAREEFRKLNFEFYSYVKKFYENSPLRENSFNGYRFPRYSEYSNDISLYCLSQLFFQQEWNKDEEIQIKAISGK